MLFKWVIFLSISVIFHVSVRGKICLARFSTERLLKNVGIWQSNNYDNINVFFLNCTLIFKK